MIFIISTSFDSIREEGSFFWGENYFPAIRDYIPLNTTDVISIKDAILFFNKTNNKEKAPLKLKITQTHITRVYLKIHYKVIEEIDNKSYRIRNALKQYFNKKSVIELPFCCAVDEERFNSILKSGELFFDINSLQEKNDWSAIYKLLEKYQPIEQSVLWNNAEALNKFSFATAKLSECTENLKKKFPDKEKRKEFLKQKKFFRELTIKLRERCIQLSNDNPAFYSNLAYTYYQSVNELNTPNGRRDGNLVRDAEKALEYFDKTLILDSSRITDIYRKAILLSEILPSYNLYRSDINQTTPDNNQLKEKYSNSIEMINRGIEEFIKLVKIYEHSFNGSDSVSKADTTEHYKKYYIKALYHLAQKRLKLAKIDFNLFNILYGYKPIIINDPNELDHKISLLNIANSYIDKCIQSDYTKKKEEKFLIDLVECDNFVLAVYKAYTKAVIETYLFTLTEKVKHLNTAKEFYHKALELNFPQHQKNQNKIFILEKVATLNLLEGKYDAAIKILEQLYIKINSNKPCRFPEYAAFTLAISFTLIGDKRKAEQIAEEYSKCGNKIFEHKFSKLKDFLKNPVSKKIESSKNN
ncbi:tetratricopeptide repeat protein [Ignavibacterium album]|uniref:tetratricopeptide repeat protein n=1 Tax=Ignavibacterium album TaxID=591197 RepID=UPI0026EEEC77|nr:hypothetical protein [Ignavibacterium album]